MQMDFNEINELLFRLLDNDISDADFARLKDWLDSGSEAKLYYCRFMSDFGVLSLRKMTSIADDLQESHFEFTEAGAVDTKPVGDSNVSVRGVDVGDILTEEGQCGLENVVTGDEEIEQDMIEILELVRSSPAVVIEKEDPPRELIQKVVHPPREKRKLTKFQKFFFVSTAAALIFFALFVKFVPVPVPSVDVATVTDQINVQWADSSFRYETGERLWTKGYPLDIKKGIVSIEYDDGVEVVIEGPALFEIERSGIYLEYGRLYSKVSETGLGFTVRTPTSQFVDQGTEFGVLADINGSSELHVTKGKVQLFAGLKNKSRTSQMITEDKAARYDANSGLVTNVKVQKEAFVRGIDSNTGFIWKGQTSLDLADVFGGGNGFGSGKTGVCLDVRSGKFTSLRGYEEGLKRPKNTANFVNVVESPYIDGVFMPDGGDGSVQVSSAGHVFDDCPDTKGWISNYSIFNGDTLKLYKYRWPVQLGNKRYGTKENPAITFAPNRGITFDLRAMRRYIGVVDIKRFTAKCGIIHRNNWVAEGDADIHVLVDGQVRFKVAGKTKSSELSIIDVELDREDRFLTLVVTEGDPSEKGNWIVFAEPVLKLSDK